MAVRILYFARVREQIGLGGEDLDMPAHIRTITALADFLATRSPGHAEAFADRTRLRVAIDQDMADFEAPIQGAQEIAFFPGDRGMRDIRVQTQDFDPGAELARLEGLDMGAVASFTGLVRGDDGVSTLMLEHYPGMTEKALRTLADEAAARWPLAGVILVHRVGALARGARIVFVGTASAHRAAALESCAFLIDRLKTDAPFWKCEDVAGARRWVDARDSDHAAADRWG